MVVGELLEAYTVSNEKVLHKTTNAVKKGSAVEQLVIIVIDSELECMQIDGDEKNILKRKSRKRASSASYNSGGKAQRE
ncbi:hypothetical protein Tco_1414171 [Tanacetum coccineum]